jgi:hypothetical protein
MRRLLTTTMGTLIGCALLAAALLPAGSRLYSRQVERITALETEVALTRAAATAASVQERIIDLPEDGNQWHTILIVCPGWQGRTAERRAEAMFHSEPLLVSLKHQTHWHLITADQPEFRKFRALVDVTPCLIVERANGEVVYRESGPELGRHPHLLTHAIRKEIQRHCPDGRCLPLHPVPGQDEPQPHEEIPAVLREEAPATKNRANPLPAVVVVGLGALLGFARKFRVAAGA